MITCRLRSTEYVCPLQWKRWDLITHSNLTDLFQYKIGQLYMIAKHSAEQSQKGEGVEVIENRPHEDPEHGTGQFTEKRIYISSKLPYWIRRMVPKIFYVTEKAWNYYPFTITEYSVELFVLQIVGQ